VSKWLHNRALMRCLIVLIALPFVHMARNAARLSPVRGTRCRALAFSLNVFGKMAVGA
jgi:hypothetical protein